MRAGVHLLTELTAVGIPESIRQSAIKALRIFIGRVNVARNTENQEKSRPCVIFVSIVSIYRLVWIELEYQY